MDAVIERCILLTSLCIPWEVCGVVVPITHKVSNIGTKENNADIALKLCVAIILKLKTMVSLQAKIMTTKLSQPQGMCSIVISGQNPGGHIVNDVQVDSIFK